VAIRSSIALMASGLAGLCDAGLRQTLSNASSGREGYFFAFFFFAFLAFFAFFAFFAMLPS
jgi:hypothetical protein